MRRKLLDPAAAGSFSLSEQAACRHTTHELLPCRQVQPASAGHELTLSRPPRRHVCLQCSHLWRYLRSSNPSSSCSVRKCGHSLPLQAGYGALSLHRLVTNGRL